MTLAEKLQQLRAENGMTQAQLAQESGMPLGTVRNYEQGIREPSWQTLFKLAEALGVSVEVFRECTGVAEAKPDEPKPKPTRSRKASQPAPAPPPAEDLLEQSAQEEPAKKGRRSAGAQASGEEAAPKGGRKKGKGK